MRSNQSQAKPPTDRPHASDEQLREVGAWKEEMARLEAEMKACKALGDDALARHAGRKLFAAVACAADALLRDGGQGLHAAPDKVGAFFDKAAAGFVQAVDGMHRRAALSDPAALMGNGLAPAGRRAADPLAAAIAALDAPSRHGR